MDKANERIRTSSDEIGEEIRKGLTKLQLLLRKAEKTLKALNVELHDEELEQESPITLPDGSLDAAGTALAAPT
jgi:hypothetical protein